MSAAKLLKKHEQLMCTGIKNGKQHTFNICISSLLFLFIAINNTDASKTGPKTDPANSNQVWGQGETPVEDILLLIKKNGWPIF